MLNLVSLIRHSLQILGKTQTDVFPISGFLYNLWWYWHELGPETKLLKRNKEMSKKFGMDVMTGNFEVTVIFLIYGQFGAIREPNSGRMVCKTYFFISGNLLKHNQKTSSTSLTHLLWVKILSIMLKHVNFLEKTILISANLIGPWD